MNSIVLCWKCVIASTRERSWDPEPNGSSQLSQGAGHAQSVGSREGVQSCLYKVANALEVLLQSFDINILAVGVKAKCLRISGHLHDFLVAWCQSQRSPSLYIIYITNFIMCSITPETNNWDFKHIRKIQVTCRHIFLYTCISFCNKKPYWLLERLQLEGTSMLASHFRPND